MRCEETILSVAICCHVPIDKPIDTIDRPIDRPTDRPTDRSTDRQIDRPTDRLLDLLLDLVFDLVIYILYMKCDGMYSLYHHLYRDSAPHIPPPTRRQLSAHVHNTPHHGMKNVVCVPYMRWSKRSCAITSKP